MSNIDITPDDGTDDLATEPRGFEVGDRVSHRAYLDRLGTVLNVDVYVRVDWDMIYGDTIEEPTDLKHDAPMPDPAYALAKGLRYRRQRDAALTDLARVAGLETEYAVKFGEQGRKLEDAREEMTLAYSRQAKLLTEATEKLTAVRAQLRIPASAWDNYGNLFVSIADIVGGVVDTPTEGVGE